MLLAKHLEKSQEIILCLLAFSIPFPYVFSPILIACLVILWLLQFDKKLFYQNLKERKILWIWIAYFLLFAFSYLYSINTKQSLFDLQSKLSFLILPMVIGAGKTISKRHLEHIFFFFSTGVTCIALFCVGRSSYIWYNSHYTLIFFYNNLIKGLDASAVYEALYSILSIIILLVFPWEQYFNRKAFYKSLMVLMQIVFFVLLSSRTLLFLFLILLIPLYFKKTFPYKQNSFIKYGVVTLIIIMVFSLFFTQNPVKQRFTDILHTEPGKIELKHDTTIYNFNNLTLRLFLWKTGLQNINEHHLWWIGAGNGDAQDLQNEKFAEYTVTDKSAKNPLIDLNMHNMYLQSLIMVGIPGLLIFIMLIFSPFLYIKYVELNYIVLFFNIVMCVFMFQESSLQTQSGIIFYSFFSMIFWNYYYSAKPNKS